MSYLKNSITLVVTSCGRLNLLQETLESFMFYADIKPNKCIVIENSGLINKEDLLPYVKNLDNPEILINETNIGQIRSIDRAYSFVDTEYIFHLEDDWKFYETGFMEKSLDVLKHIPNIININLRRRFDGTRGSMHPINSESLITSNNTIYHTYQYNYNNVYHGFSFNPGLRRTSDYKILGLYQNYGNEERIGDFYYHHGYQAACLEKSYCYHLAEHFTSQGANQ
jgi:hypothetical protein